MILNEDSTKVRYDVIAKLYANGSPDIPHWKLENEICKRALGDCTGYRVLDLAGSTGDHARSCIEAGASRVDVVDPNAKMMEIGADIERKAGRNNMIHWHKACVFSPLEASLPKLPHAGYDLVLAFWPWDQAGTFQEYVGVWRNAAAYLKPGGRLVGCRVVNPWARAIASWDVWHEDRVDSADRREGGQSSRYHWDGLAVHIRGNRNRSQSERRYICTKQAWDCRAGKCVPRGDGDLSRKIRTIGKIS